MRVLVRAGGFLYLAEGPPTLNVGDRVLVEAARLGELPFAGIVADLPGGTGAPRRVLEVLPDEVEVEVELTDG